MKNEVILNLRQFPVVAHDHRTGNEEAIVVAQIVGQSSTELITRLCERQGYTPGNTCKPYASVGLTRNQRSAGP